MPIADGIEYFRPNGRADFDAGGNVLAYNARDAEVSDREGTEVGQLTMPGAVHTFRMSPDGQQISVAVNDPVMGTADIWIHDVSRDLPTRLTFDSATEAWPVWSPAGDELLFGSDRAGPPDGRDFLVSSAGDVLTLGADGSETPTGLLTNPFFEGGPRFSPDGASIAYVPDESGGNEVYVRRFPGGGDGQRVSRSGGVLPVWGADSREVFYLGRDRTLFAAPVTSDPFDVGIPVALFADAAGSFDVAPDGERFLMRAPSDGASTDELLVVLSWSEELRNQDPAN